MLDKDGNEIFKRRGYIPPERMTGLAPVDSIDVQILVDNVTDSLSSVPSFVETELGGLARRRGAAWVLGGACLCCAAHGLSCLLTLRRGDSVHTVLFDSGPEDRTFEQNVSRLGIDLGPVEAMVLSHGHWDHAGAMLRALQLERMLSPFTRCRECNTLLEDVTREAVLDRLPPMVREAYSRFKRCPGCGRAYWEGTHYERMMGVLTRLGTEFSAPK